ncbi:MAG: substrate-binding domain-containing protein [Burkholderiales bacterium]
MTLKTMIAALAALLVLGPATAAAAELRVLSAGAVEPGLRPVLAAFENTSGHTVLLTFATAPQIRERISAGAAFDVVIAPPGVLGDAGVAKRIDADPAARVSIGRVGIGVAVRPGAPRPDIGSAEAFKRAMVEADSLVFNRASTGIYIEAMLARLGVESGSRITRYPDGASVMAHVVKGQGREIGLGAITEILLAHDQGLQFVGPLPPALQNFTTYRAAAAATPADRDIARALLKHLASPGAQASFVAAGIEAAD